MSSPTRAPKPSGFIQRLAPMFKLGTEHEAIRALVAALQSEKEDLVVRSIELGLTAEERAWWAGGANAVSVLVDELTQELDDQRARISG